MHRKSTHTWNKLKQYPAGKRFEFLFNHRRTMRTSLIKRLMFLCGGFFVMIVGFVTLPTPVPGILLLFIGASLIAQESLFAARMLDWTELKVRTILNALTAFWQKSHISIKILLTFSLVCLLGLVGTRVLLIFLT